MSALANFDRVLDILSTAATTAQALDQLIDAISVGLGERDQQRLKDAYQAARLRSDADHKRTQADLAAAARPKQSGDGA